MTTARRPPGRPRDERVDAAIRAAARDLLLERGYAAVTVDAVAARAGVGKAAIYRRVQSRAELLFAAAVHDVELPEPADTGSLAGDVAALVDVIVSALTNPAAARAFPHLLAELSGDGELTARFEATFLRQELAMVDTVLRRAAHRGELTDPPPVEAARALVLGGLIALFFTSGASGPPPDAVEVHTRLVHAALLGYGSATGAGARS